MSADRLQNQIPRAEKGINKEQIFQLAITSGIHEALGIIDQNFETTSITENQLAYHRRSHTEGVISRTGLILKAIQHANPGTSFVTDRDVALGEFAAAWHDTVQESKPNDVTDAQGYVMKKRKRALGDNERESADLAEGYMRSVNKQMGRVFSRKDIQIVREAIMLTVPNFDVTLGTVTQPNFAKHKRNLIAQAVALGDLGGGGMEGFSTAQWESDSLFLEDNMDFAAFRKAYENLAMSNRRLAALRVPLTEGWYHDRMTRWLESQLRFSEGRQGQLQQEIATMDQRAQEPVRQLFTKYNETLDGMQGFIDKRRTMDFPTWMTQLHDTLQNPPRYT